MSFPVFSVLSPLVVLLMALLFIGRSGCRPGTLPRIAEAAALAALGLAGANLLQLFVTGPSSLAMVNGLVLMRLDAISATMTLLVGFVGWVVVRYSRTYLDGEAREGAK